MPLALCFSAISLRCSIHFSYFPPSPSLSPSLLLKNINCEVRHQLQLRSRLDSPLLLLLGLCVLLQVVAIVFATTFFIFNLQLLPFSLSLFLSASLYLFAAALCRLLKVYLMKSFCHLLFETLPTCRATFESSNYIPLPPSSSAALSIHCLWQAPLSIFFFVHKELKAVKESLQKFARAKMKSKLAIFRRLLLLIIKCKFLCL